MVPVLPIGPVISGITMLPLFVALALIVVPPEPFPPSPVTVCNAMIDTLDNVTFTTPSWEDVAVIRQINPHECAQLQQLSPGNYMMTYIDTGSTAPMCRLTVSVKVGSKIEIKPHGKAVCQT